MQRSRGGYTLIEIMVVIVIMSLLVGGGLAGYTKFNDRQTILVAGRQLIASMRQAQQYSASGIKPVGCDTGLRGYRVTAASGGSTYTVAAICTTTGTTVVVKQETLAAGVQFASNVDVTFLGQVGGAQTTNPTVTLSQGTLTYQLTISSSGDITEVGIP